MKKTSLFLVCALVLLSTLPGIAWSRHSEAPPTPSGTLDDGSAERSTTDISIQQPTRTPATLGENVPNSLPTAELTFPTLSAPLPSDEAQAAISQFNRDQLGATTQIAYAGNAINSIQTVLEYLPVKIQTAMLSASSIGTVTYWGMLSSGAAMVAVGDCVTDITYCAVNANNLSVQLSSASTGVYVILVNETATSPEAATNLIMATFPKINGLMFTGISDIGTGFAFSAVTANISHDAHNRQTISIPEVVYAGTVPSGSGTFVYALVALGQGYVNAVGL